MIENDPVVVVVVKGSFRVVLFHALFVTNKWLSNAMQQVYTNIVDDAVCKM